MKRSRKGSNTFSRHCSSVYLWLFASLTVLHILQPVYCLSSPCLSSVCCFSLVCVSERKQVRGLTCHLTDWLYVWLEHSLFTRKHLSVYLSDCLPACLTVGLSEASEVYCQHKCTDGWSISNEAWAHNKVSAIDRYVSVLSYFALFISSEEA